MKNPKQIFSKLWKQNNLIISDMNPADIGCLQLMLIGCKPAINNNQLALNTKNILLEYGYISKGNWIYDPKQINDLSAKYPNIFKEDIYKCFQKPMEQLDDMLTGLLMGIPFEAAQKFVKLSNKKSNTISKIYVNIFGHCWVEYSEMEISSLKYISHCLDKMESNNMLNFKIKETPPDWKKVYTCNLSVSEVL